MSLSRIDFAGPSVRFQVFRSDGGSAIQNSSGSSIISPSLPIPVTYLQSIKSWEQVLDILTQRRYTVQLVVGGQGEPEQTTRRIGGKEERAIGKQKGMESSSLFHFHTLSTLLLYFDSITPFNSILAPFRPSDRSISHPDRLQTTPLSRNRPANWKANTAVASVGIIAATYAIWQYSADREVSPVQHRGQDSQGLVDERQEDEQD